MNISSKDVCRRRGGTDGIKGFKYEYLVPALFALRVIERSDIVDMSLTTNVDGMGAFDDILLFLEYENGKRNIYIIQLKNKKESITASKLKESKDYNICKYQNSYDDILTQMKDSEFHNRLENVKPKDIYFILYTSSELLLPLDKDTMTQLNLVLTPGSADLQELSLLNTNDQNSNCIYKFKTADSRKAGKMNEDFLSHFYLFTNQAEIDTIVAAIQNLVTNRYGCEDESFKLSFLNYIESWLQGDLRIHYLIENMITEELSNSSNTSPKINFKRFLEMSQNRDLDEHYKIRKKHIQLYLTELLIKVFVVKPTDFIKIANEELWIEVMNSAEVIIVQNYTQEMIYIIWHAINTILYSYCGKKLKKDTSWKSSNWFTLEDLPKKDQKGGLEVLNRIKQNNPVTFEYVCFALWKIGGLPLLLKAEDQSDVNNIAKALMISRAESYQKRIVLLYKEEDTNLYEHFNSHSVIHNLDNIHNKHLTQRLLQKMMISLQGRKELELSKLVSATDNILESISTTMILSMLYRTQMIPKCGKALPENYIQRKLRRILLKIDVLNLKDVGFIIYGAIEDIKSTTNPWRVIDGRNDLKQVDFKTSNSKPKNIVALEEGYEIGQSELKHFLRCNVKIHYLRYFNGYLEWIRSIGPVSDIKRYVVDNTEFFINEDDILKHFVGDVNIISANPGMGKSVMIDFLSEKYRENYWVEVITLNEQITDVNGDVPDMAFPINKVLSFHKQFTEALINILRRNKKIVYLVDAFDEILPNKIEYITLALKKFKNEGFPLWITTRPVRGSYLEEKMNVVSVSLNSICPEKQTLYFKAYFEKLDKKDCDAFIEKLQILISKSFPRLDLEFSSVPLHLYMITEVFKETTLEELINWKEITTLDIYEDFIIKKIKIYLQKKLDGVSETNSIYMKELENTRKQHAKAALLVFYQKDLLDKIINLNKIEKFLTNTYTGKDNIGIIMCNNRNNNIPTFFHRTFAEYLTAKFLTSRISKDKIKPLLNLLFNEELTVIRQLFDKILAKGHPLHVAVLNHDLNEVKALLNNSSAYTDSDLGGRTPLHLAAAWGTRHRFPNSNTVSTSENLPFNVVIINRSQHELIFKDENVLELLTIILKSNKFPNQADTLFGWYPLDYATHSCSIDALNTLCNGNDGDQSVDVFKYFNLNSLIFYCVKYGYKEILRKLTLNSYIYDDILCGRNLLHIAMENENNCFDTFQILLTKCPTKLMDLYLQRYDQTGALPIMYAALRGNVEIFKTLLEHAQKIDLNKCNLYGLTLLHCLVLHNHKNCIVELLSNPNIDINVKTNPKTSRTNHSYTALYFAVNNNNVEVLRLLIQKGANIFLEHENKRTVLHVASIMDSIDCLDELCKNGLDLNISDENGKTALLYAAQNVKLASINYLLKLGADISKTDNCNRNVFHYAVQNLKLEQIVLPENVANSMVNNKDKNGKTPLHYIIENIKLDRLKYLSSFNNRDSDWLRCDLTSLRKLPKEDKLNNIKFLIKSGANIDETDNDELTPLQHAVKKGDLESMVCLLELGADVNQTDNKNCTPLFNAVQSRKTNVIEELLKFHPDVNKWDTRRRTPLYLAAIKGYNKCAQLLISSEANINLNTFDGCTPLFVAIMQNNYSLVKLLIEYGANVNRISQHEFEAINSDCCERFTENVNFLTPLQMAVQLKNIKIIKCILESKVKINQTDNNERTALHIAMEYDCLDCVEDLIKKGAGLHLEDVNGSTPIHIAVKHNRCEILKTALGLSNYVKAINKFNKNKESALHIAASNGCLECAKILVEKGADVEARTSEGLSAIDIATTRGHENIRGLLTLVTES